ncbi:hypothetical protein D3C84_1035950 [compost metagenome]
MGAVEGYDKHDWYSQLPKHLGCEHIDLMRGLVENWLIDNLEVGRGFVQELMDQFA